MLGSQSQPYLTGKLRSPEPNTDRSRLGSVERGRPSELPNIDRSMMVPNARYSITYVPGLSEHAINTGLTLPEAQVKVVLLACEVERLTNINYTLVKENEMLKITQEKGNREVDLETKLAIVLAENEKLNQVIEELHTLYNQLPQGADESRASVLARDLEDWKNRYNDLARSKGVISPTLQQATPSGNIEELNNLRRENDENQKKLADLSNKVKSLLDENDKLHTYINNLKKETTQQPQYQPVPSPYQSQIQYQPTSQFQSGPTTPKGGEPVDFLKLKQLQDENENLRNRINSLEKLPPQVQALLVENDRLNRLSSEKIQQYNDIKGKIGPIEDLLKANDALLRENDRMNKENEVLRQKIVQGAGDELKHQVEVLIIENDRLNNQISQMQRQGREVDFGGRGEDEEQEKRAGLGGPGAGTKSLELQKRLGELAAENDRLNNQNEALRRDIDTLRQLGTAKSDDQRIGYLNSEIERLQGHLNHSLNEVEEWRKRYSELEIARAQEIDELRYQFEAFKRGSIDAREQQVKFGAERTAYETQIAQLQQKIGDLEHENHTLMAENERLGHLSREKANLAEQYRRKIEDLDQKAILDANNFRAQLEIYKSNNYDIKQLAIKYGADKAADQSQIKQLKQMNENYKAELDKIYELLNQRKVDFDALIKQNEQLRDMYEKLAGYVRGQDNTGADQSIRLDALQKENSELEAARDEFKKQADRNSVELTRKNKELVDKIQELDILKMKYEEALANYQALNSKLFEKLMDEK